MTPGITANTRTLRAYASDLLQYARWIIERDVDFTDCRQRGSYDSSLPECVECRFGGACHWLDQNRSPSMEDASLDDMVDAIERACEYLESEKQMPNANDPELHNWIHKAHRFLRARRE